MSTVVCASSGHLWKYKGEDLHTIGSFGEEADRVDDERILVRELDRTLAPSYYFFEDAVETRGKQACLLIPIMDGDHCLAITSLVASMDHVDSAEANLAILMAIAERSTKYLLGSRIAEMEDALIRNSRAQKIVEGVGKHIDLKQVAYDVVNRWQHYLVADRVSLAICRGHSSQIKGISNQAVFD